MISPGRRRSRPNRSELDEEPAGVLATSNSPPDPGVAADAAVLLLLLVAC